MKALIHNGIVIQVCESEFEVHPSMSWVYAADDCQPDWKYENGQFIAPPASPEKTYKDQRAAAYPPITDQLDQIYHEGVDAWKATILAVKEEFPK